MPIYTGTRGIQYKVPNVSSLMVDLKWKLEASVIKYLFTNVKSPLNRELRWAVVGLRPVDKAVLKRAVKGRLVVACGIQGLQKVLPSNVNRPCYLPNPGRSEMIKLSALSHVGMKSSRAMGRSFPYSIITHYRFSGLVAYYHRSNFTLNFHCEPQKFGIKTPLS